MPDPDRVQIHLALPFKQDPGVHPKVRRYLEGGFRITDLQRLSDRDALVTLARSPATQASS